jgi:hypothetical protein
MHSKVSFDWLPSYIMVTRPVLEIFKMVRYFPDSPRMARKITGDIIMNWDSRNSDNGSWLTLIINQH